MVPLGILAAKSEPNRKEELIYDNGIVKASGFLMHRVLFTVLDKNMRKKVKTISDTQFIEIFEQSVELMQLNHELAKKLILGDLIKQKISCVKIADRFIAAEQ